MKLALRGIQPKKNRHLVNREVCAAPPVKIIVPSAIQLVRRITDITLVVEINGDAIMQRIVFEMTLGKIADEALLVVSPLGFC